MNRICPCQIICHVICCRTDCISPTAAHTLCSEESVSSKPQSHTTSTCRREQNINVDVRGGIPHCFRLNKNKHKQIIKGIVHFLRPEALALMRGGLMIHCQGFWAATPRCYLGDCGLVFFHQLIHVLLILLHAGLQVVLLPLQSAELLVQLSDGERGETHTLAQSDRIYSWAIEYDKWSLAGRAAAVLESHRMAMKHNLDRVLAGGRDQLKIINWLI